MYQKVKDIMFFLILTFSFTSYSDTLFFEINSKSRKIMADGFLFEWKRYSSKNWGKSRDNFFDICFTSEGWCGYVTFLPKNNEKWEFVISDSFNQYNFYFFKDSLHTDHHIKAAFSKDKKGIVIIEWALLNKKIEEEKNNNLTFTGWSNDGDSLPFILTKYVALSETKKINPFSLLWVLTIFGVLIFLISIIKKPMAGDHRGGLPPQ
ncbi:MAG: hypothetical protein N2053_05125 [Chitinispirillaceae bacterium]|nr:hypothetical protein [Chitinispirillaceae bacterium]